MSTRVSPCVLRVPREYSEYPQVEAHSTILYAGVRPEFRGAIACFLASTSKENRARFAQARPPARLRVLSVPCAASTLRECCKYPCVST